MKRNRHTQQRAELLGEVVERLMQNGAAVCLMDGLYPETILKQLRVSQNATAYASLSLPHILAILPNGDALWIYVYLSKMRRPTLPLEPILFLTALAVYEVDSLHILKWHGKVYGLTMDDVWRAMDKVVIPRCCAEHFETEREYVATALLPSDVQIVYDDDVPFPLIQLYPDRLTMLADWQLQLDVCFAGVSDEHI